MEHMTAGELNNVTYGFRWAGQWVIWLPVSLTMGHMVAMVSWTMGYMAAMVSWTLGYMATMVSWTMGHMAAGELNNETYGCHGELNNGTYGCRWTEQWDILLPVSWTIGHMAAMVSWTMGHMAAGELIPKLQCGNLRQYIFQNTEYTVL
jgi:hypothetical protein